MSTSNNLNWIDNQREVWRGKEEYWHANDDYGMCNTGSREKITCLFGGVCCNVDHQFVYIRNMLNGILNESKTVA